MADRIPPHNNEAEQAVLGAMLLSADAATGALSLLDDVDFYRAAHARVFRAMQQLHNTERAIDPVSVTDQLATLNELDAAGGKSYLLDLTDAAYASNNWSTYASIVKRDSAARQHITAFTELTARAYDGIDDLDDFTAEVDSTLSSVRPVPTTVPGKPIQGAVDELLDWVHTRVANPGINGIPTGFGRLDTVIDGLAGGRLYIVAARPSVGKSALAENIAINVASRGHKTLLIELEQQERQALLRMACSISWTSSQAAKHGALTPGELERFERGIGKLYTLPIVIEDTAALPINQLEARIIAHRPDVLIVDYLQLLSHPGITNREQGIAHISRTLKMLAKKYDIPVIALSQMSRAVAKEDRRPRLDDLRESGAIEQDADVVMFIDRRNEAPTFGGSHAPPSHTFIVAKNRDGELADIDVAFVDPWTRFFEVAQPIRRYE